MYVALEGIDTSGKSTQIESLKKDFPHAIFTKEPGGSMLGIEIREMILKEHNTNNNYQIDAKTEFLLFLADRAEHIAKIIKPNQDKLIISDRSLISGIAYARNIQGAKELNLFATDNIIPDLVIILELDKKTLQDRLGKKSNDAIEQRGIQYLLDIQKNIKSIAERLQKDFKCKVEVIDASKPKETIEDQIKELIMQKI
ncbi:dTMP kinase [Helicobacter cappadocius]|uniref:Thymidylate kinase n=1 Tax=Helicobacter cappadocius TaxID=3063998 RepID=A0AA90Q3P6_9HELI|nr:MULTISPECIES: dTMP kinase [unclassified Helicobacter]MDO7253650.1 dTMP kinase [Helicobacter sp. faydin-H75]MDP2539578.1 dTMP kinase [Helicobacter sp. faydin-H76]